jgi:hypothetical protein
MVLFGACDDDEASAEEIQEVEDTIRAAFESGPAEAELVFASVTDNVLETVFFATREDCQANVEECIGEPTPVESISNTEIDGDDATAMVGSELGSFEVALTREGDAWRVDSLEAASDEVPDGAEVVDLELADFAFVLDTGEIPSDGNFAFRIENTGEQTHEVVLVAIPEGMGVEEAVETVGTEENSPLGFKVFIRPGQEDLAMAFEAALEPGSYALVCFFPDTTDPEGAVHVEKGMLAEFSVE